MTGLHAAMLAAAGHTIWRVPRARVRHAAPNGLTHFVWRFLLFGHDGVVVPRLVAAERRAAGRPPKQTRHTFGLAWRWVLQAAKKLQGELRQKPSRAPELFLVVPIVTVAMVLQAAGAAAGLIASPQLLAAMPEDILRASTCEPGVAVRQVAPGG